MLMHKGEHWTCMNPFCGGNVTLMVSRYSPEDPPQCVCGTPLRMVPHFNYLEFLRPDATEPPAARKKRDA
jgi:hypothetical protein